jgi:hypothetical protein
MRARGELAANVRLHKPVTDRENMTILGDGRLKVNLRRRGNDRNPGP